MIEINEPGRIHPLGSGLVRVPTGRPATVSIDPRRGSAIADSLIVEVIGKYMSRSG